MPREKLFISAKVVGTKDQDIHAALNTSLDKLGLKYVDLYLVHVPYSAGSPEGLQAIWKQVEDIKELGKAKSIGVSNFMQDDLEIILKTARIPPVINQIEYHPYLQHGDLLSFLRQQNIACSAYSSLSAITAARPGPVDEVYAALAQKYDVTECDIAFRWCLDQGIAVTTTTSKEQRLQGYLNKTFKFRLSDEEIAQITEKGKQKHYRGMTNGMFLFILNAPQCVVTF